MSLTGSSIRRSRVTAVVIGVLLLSGTSAYLNMPQQMDPGFIVRVAQVVTRFPGASPERVEQLVTDPIEQAVQAIPELDFISSTSRTGVSVVAVNIREEFKEMRPIWDDLRRRVAFIEKDLPAGSLPPEINDELGDVYPMIFSMSGDGFSDRELSDYAETIRDQILRIDGVAKVEILGTQDERVFIEYSNARLAHLGISPGYLMEALRSRNIIMPGGEIDVGHETIPLEPSGNFGSVEELGETLIPLPAGGLVSLRDITDVKRAYVDPPRSVVTTEGRQALAFAVSMADGNNLVELGKALKKFFDELPEFYPHGIDFALAYYQPQEVEQKVEEFTGSVVQAVVIVLIVMLLFLGLRTGVIVSALIPAAMIIALWVLSGIGESINQMSLASLIIALGLLVDNAIVVSELIMVRMGQGEKPIDAAVASCQELQVPLLVSSLTTSAAFLPIFLAESAVGEYTGILFTVVTITLLVSWLLALTMTPLLCVQFLKISPSDIGENFEGRFYQIYRSMLRWVLRRRVLSLGFVVLAFFASLPLWGMVPSIFFPAQERPFFMAEFSLPPGTNITATQRMATEVDAFIEHELKADEGGEGVTSWTTFIGATPPPFTLGYSPSPSRGGYCELMVHTTSVETASVMMQRLQRFAIGSYPDVHTHIRMLSAGPPVDKPVEVRLSGPDIDRVFAEVDTVKRQLSEIPGVRDIQDDWGARVKKLTVGVDEARARRAGLSNQDVAQSLQTFLRGLETTRFREANESIPVMVRSVGRDRRDLDRVRNLSMMSPQTAQTVPLSQVADINLVWENSAILRRDRYRTVTIQAGITDETTALAVFDALRPWLDARAKNWELGYRWEFGGEYESSVKANASIGEKLPIGMLLIVLLLVWQFNSFRKPVIVLSAIVLGLIGVVIGLVVMKSSFGFMTLLGVVSLAGIVINNAIVLLDRIQIEIDQGTAPTEAIVTAAQQRMRPILLTTATTVASLLPLYISGGAMWEPMAVAIMFGLVFSTALTLLVVPLMYALLFRVPQVN